MKKKQLISAQLIIISALFLILATSCKKSDENDPSVIKDGDGNTYTSVTIGTQVWIVENLKSTKLNDGTPIPLVTDQTAWKALTTMGYCWYDNNETEYKSDYGTLYNWYAANNVKLCPKGWHVPTDAEWTTLENYLIANGYNYDGTTTDNKIAKSLASTTLWTFYQGGTGTVGFTDYPTKRNATGFTAFPGGSRGDDGIFYELGISGFWWSATEYDAKNAWNRSLRNISYSMFRTVNDKKSGFSVRCIKD